MITKDLNTAVNSWQKIVHNNIKMHSINNEGLSKDISKVSRVGFVNVWILLVKMCLLIYFDSNASKCNDIERNYWHLHWTNFWCKYKKAIFKASDYVRNSKCRSIAAKRLVASKSEENLFSKKLKIRFMDGCLSAFEKVRSQRHFLQTRVTKNWASLCWESWETKRWQIICKKEKFPSIFL